MDAESVPWIARFIVLLLQSIFVWPTAVLILGVWLLRAHRKDISLALGRIKRAKVPGAQIDFDESKQQLEPPRVEGNALVPAIAQIREHPEVAAQAIQNLARALDFERIYNSIFRSQWEFLGLLSAAGATGVPIEQAAAYVTTRAQEAQVAVPDLAQWLRFLEITGTVERRESNLGVTFAITAKGLDLLKYMRETYPAGQPPRLL